MIDRRGLLKGLAGIFIAPTKLRAGGLVPSARLIDTTPILLSEGCSYNISKEMVGRYASKLHLVNSNLAPLKVFTKSGIEPYEESGDTSIVFDFGVSIYADPSGIFTEGESFAQL